MNDRVFSPRLVLIWIMALASTFLVSLAVMSFGGGDKGEMSQAASPNTFSRSAIGHAAFAELLRQLDIPVVQSTFASRGKLGSGGVLVIAEPEILGEPLAPLSDLLKAPKVLLILPKRYGLPDEGNPRWIAQSGLIPVSVATAALAAAAPDGGIDRRDAAQGWSTNRLGIAPDPVAPIQLMRSPQLTPIVANGDEMLVGGVEKAGRQLWILSDPDVVANHGIVQADNAAFAVALIDALRKAGAPVVFDETIHGFAGAPPSPVKLLFTFPYALATALGVAAIGLLLWATLARFGPPERMPALPAGKYRLIGNAARLLDDGGHQRVIVRRYVEVVMRDIARRLHAPRGLSDAALVEWFRRAEETRGITLDCGAIYRRAIAAAEMKRDDGALLLPIARDIYRWKGAMLDGFE
jgi:hypothetical protein